MTEVKDLEQLINNRACIKTLSRIKYIETYKDQYIIQYEMVCPVTGGHSDDWFYTVLDPETYREKTPCLFQDLEVCKQVIDLDAYNDMNKIREILIAFNAKLK